MVQGRAIWTNVAGIWIAAVVLMVGCASERAVEPGEGTAALALLGWDVSPGRVWLAVMDTETDSIIGEIPDVGSRRAIELSTTRDGRFAATMDLGEGIRIFDLYTFSLIGQAPHPGLASIEVISDRSRIFATDYLAPGVVYTLPSLQIDTVLPVGYRKCMTSPKPGEAVVITRTPGGEIDPTWDGAARLSTDNWAVLDSFRFVSPITWGRLRSFQTALSRDGEILYTLAMDGAGYGVFAFGMVDHICLFRTPVVELAHSYVVANPGGEEIWVTQGYPNNGTPVPTSRGHVLIIDAHSGVVLDTLRTLGLRADRPDEPFPLGPLAFHPTEPKAYLCSGYPYQSLLVVNTRSRQVDAILEAGPLYDIAIVPR